MISSLNQVEIVESNSLWSKFKPTIDEFIQCKEKECSWPDKMTRYSSPMQSFSMRPYGCLEGDKSYFGIDLPIIIHPENPINREKNPVVAIVGEAPARKYGAVGEISVGFTFGQHDKTYEDFPRVYDLVIDWYLDRGFDVYLTNLSKWTKYFILDNEIVSNASFIGDDTVIDDLHDEFKRVSPSHIIWLGDSKRKRFIYGETVYDLHIDYTIFPHPSGANNKKWTERLGNKPCTKENKADYIVKKSNVLYLDDGKLKSTIN